MPPEILTNVRQWQRLANAVYGQLPTGQVPTRTTATRTTAHRDGCPSWLISWAYFNAYLPPLMCRTLLYGNRWSWQLRKARHLKHSQYLRDLYLSISTRHTCPAVWEQSDALEPLEQFTLSSHCTTIPCLHVERVRGDSGQWATATIFVIIISCSFGVDDEH